MSMLGERERAAVKDLFQNLDKPVKLVHFTQELMCETCPDTKRLLQDVASISDKVVFEEHNYTLEKELAEKYHIDKVPATVVEVDQNTGIRFYGLPSGYEFTSLLHAILAASRSETDLSPTSKEELKTIGEPLRIQVFVTPT